MIYYKLNEFLDDVGKRRYLGLDLGSKTIGVAVSDEFCIAATPVEIIQRKKFAADVARLKELVAQREIGAFVLGYPKNMDGSEGGRCQSTRQFARNLEEFFDLPMLMWDERLSSCAVEKTMLEADISRQKRKKNIDKLAASFILQGVLDAIS